MNWNVIISIHSNIKAVECYIDMVEVITLNLIIPKPIFNYFLEQNFI